jgi:hypothetical protein
MPSPTPNQSSSQTASQGSPGQAQQGQQAQQAQQSQQGSGGGQGYPGGPGSYGFGLSLPRPTEPDPDLVAFHVALDSALHGSLGGLRFTDLYWSGKDEAGVTLTSIKDILAKAVPPSRPTNDQPPASSAKKQGA